jgi:hypothetical protein
MTPGLVHKAFSLYQQRLFRLLNARALAVRIEFRGRRPMLDPPMPNDFTNPESRTVSPDQ